MAVIAILAIIILIAVPLILGVIDNAKKDSFRNSVLGVFKAAELKFVKEGIKTGNIKDLAITNNTFRTGTFLYDNLTGKLTLTEVCDGSYYVDAVYSDNLEGFTITKDKKGNCAQPIIINGNNPHTPTIEVSMPDTLVILMNSAFNYKTYITSATDLCEGDIKDKVTATSVDTSKPGTYPVTFSVKNSAGKEATVTKNLKIDEPYLADLVKFGDYIVYPNSGVKNIFRVTHTFGVGSAGTVRIVNDEGIATYQPADAYDRNRTLRELKAYATPYLNIEYAIAAETAHKALLKTFIGEGAYTYVDKNVYGSDFWLTDNGVQLYELKYINVNGMFTDTKYGINGTVKVIVELKPALKVVSGKGTKAEPYTIGF